MLFRTFDPYYDDTIKKVLPDLTSGQEECFICLETTLDNETKLIKLNGKNDYLKKCECDGTIHEKCLDKWVNIHNSCPICRSIIMKENFTNFNNTNKTILGCVFMCLFWHFFMLLF